MNLPLYTALAAAALAVLQVILMARVIAQRGKTEQVIGDGGHEDLVRAIRTHGNLIENAPVFLVALLIAETIAGSNMVVLGLAVVFVLARLAHAFGLGTNSGVSVARFVGTLGTMLSTVTVAGYLAYLVITKL